MLEYLKTNELASRDIIFIKDRLKSVLINEIEILGYEHSFDKLSLLKNDCINNPGFGFINDSFYLFEKYESKQKARERAFEILCHFRTFLAHLGRFSVEYSSFNDNEFYLLSIDCKLFKLVKVSLTEDKYIKTKISNELLQYLLNYYLTNDLLKYRFGLIILDENQSSVLHVLKEYINKYNFYISNENETLKKKEDIKSKLISYFIIVSNGLSKKNKVKLVSFVGDLEMQIDLNDLDKYLGLIDKKVCNILYNNSLAKYLENLENGNYNNISLCYKCAKEINKKSFIVKNFSQDLSLKSCCKCSSRLNVLSYLIK